MGKTHAVITGVQGYVPDYVLTNKELETIVDTNDEWITSRTGIKERRILKGDYGSSYMAEQACKKLLEKTGTDPMDIDIILVATVTPDYTFPTVANLLGEKLGAKNAFGYDLSAACSGFLYGLDNASSYIESGRAKKVILVGVDKMSSIIDYEDRATCIIFGDGAGAVLLEATEDDNVGIKDAILRQDGVGEPYLNIKGGGSRYPSSYETVDKKMHYLHQEGATVFKYAVSNMADVAVELLEKNGLKGEDISYLVPHQANKRIIDATAKRAGIPSERVMLNISHYGNTTAATIPLCLWDYESKLKKGDNLLLAAFGGGFTWGSLWLKWGYNPS